MFSKGLESVQQGPVLLPLAWVILAIPGRWWFWPKGRKNSSVDRILADPLKHLEE